MKHSNFLKRGLDMSDQDFIYKMKLHEEQTKPSQYLDIKIIRVPGGWIYANKIYDVTTGYSYLNNMVFVPFNNEFQAVDHE